MRHYQVQACYHTISNAVFKKGWFSAAQQLTYTGAKYDGRVLEDCLRDEHGDPNLLDTPSTPRTFVVSTMSSVVPAVPFLWRNYAHTLANPSRYLGTCNACTVTALRATSAAPSYFDDVVHDGACLTLPPPFPHPPSAISPNFTFSRDPHSPSNT